MRTWGLICVVLLLVTITSVASSADPAPYLGVYSEVNEDPPGLRIQLAPASPAADAGLRNGDVILGIDDVMFGDSETPFAEQLTAAIAAHKIGDVITMHVYRDAPEMSLLKNGERVDTPWPRDEFDDAVEQSGFGDTVELKSEKLEQYIDLQATLGPRPDTVGESIDLSDLNFDPDDEHPEIRALANELVTSQELESETEDLFGRLSARALPDDGYRLKQVAALLQDGFATESVTRQNSDHFSRGVDLKFSYITQADVWLGLILDEEWEELNVDEYKDKIPDQDYFQLMNEWFLKSADLARQAFTELTEEEKSFILESRLGLSDVFSHEHYIDVDDTNRARVEDNLRLIRLAKKLDRTSLCNSMAAAKYAAGRAFHPLGRQSMLDEFGEMGDGEILYDEETEYGRIVISGTGESWFTGPQPALHIDLGGDDFYTYTEGGGSSLDTPVGVIIDLGGNDAYESTTPFCQGSGSMGVSLLVDVEGDDSYIGLQWAQGCGFFGCGALIDMAGNDTYRGEEFCQAAAIFGTGLLIDYAGDDRFEAQMKSQGFGGAHAVGLLIDVAGDDYRYAKGKYPTGYGDPGIFDAWSQGCAMGFRGLASGGIAGVIDMAGSDYNEAGNFSQGGGYYFGYGFFHDMGWENDVYVGSRYNQGFSAHQAVGCFLEDGGDDRYYTRQAVAHGLAWDECVTMFIDYGGDDYYDGGTGFSQGASAHNSICIFWDVDGRDTYVYPPGQARAGGNDYHGGTSLSLFIDTGGDTDWYDSDRSGNNLVTGWPEHGFFADLPGTLEAAVEGEAWKTLWQTYISE